MPITVSTARIQGVYKHSQVTDELSSSTENIQDGIGDTNGGRILTVKDDTNWRGLKKKEEEEKKKKRKRKKTFE